MQHGLEGNSRFVCQRVAQCQCAMCGQLCDEPIRQRLDCAVVLLLDGFGWRAADRDDRALDYTIGGWPVIVGLSLYLAFGIDDAGCLIFRPHVATGDRQQTLGIDADEDAGAGDLGRIVDKRSRFQKTDRAASISPRR